MYKLFSLLSVCVVLFSTAACIRGVPLSEAQAAYCTDLKAYGQAVANVRNLPADATVDDFDAAMKEVDQAYNELENSAWDLSKSQTDALKPAYQELRASLDTIDNGTPIVEARQVISDSWATYKDTYLQTVQFSCTAQAQ